jgi:hypothetical protein
MLSSSVHFIFISLFIIAGPRAIVDIFGIKIYVASKRLTRNP